MRDNHIVYETGSGVIVCFCTSQQAAQTVADTLNAHGSDGARWAVAAADNPNRIFQYHEGADCMVYDKQGAE